MIVTEKYTYSHGGYGSAGKQPERQVRAKRLGRGILPSCVALTIAPIPTPVTGQASYLYDGNGNLARGIINGVVTFYPGRHYNREVDGAAVTVKKFYTLGSTTVAVRTVQGSNDTLNWILGDHLGSASVTANADGTWNSEIKYRGAPPEGAFPAGGTAFGEVRASYGLTPTDYRYTGQLEQAELGLYYYVARWYDPSIMMFVSPDTLIPDLYNPLDWNRFSYARYNPIRNSDPTGHWVETALDIAFIAYDIYDIKTNGLNWLSGLSLAADVAGAILPVVTGAGLAVRALSHVDDVADAANAADGIIDAVETANKTDDILDAVSHGDDLADTLSHVDDLPDDALVCRGGECGAGNFANGSGVTINPDGTLSGASVQSAPGVPLEQLAGYLPNNQVGVSTVGDVRAFGGNVVPQPRPGNPYHAELSGITSQIAQQLFQPTLRNPVPKYLRAR